MFVYEYIDETPRDFPTLGLRGVQKGDRIESENPIVSEHVKDITPTKKPKGSEA